MKSPYTHINVSPVASLLDNTFEANSIEAEKQQRLAYSAPELLSALEALTFIAETVAHLQGLEREILPAADNARAIIARAKGLK